MYVLGVVWCFVERKLSEKFRMRDKISKSNRRKLVPVYCRARSYIGKLAYTTFGESMKKKRTKLTEPTTARNYCEYTSYRLAHRKPLHIHRVNICLGIADHSVIEPCSSWEPFFHHAYTLCCRCVSHFFFRKYIHNIISLLFSSPISICILRFACALHWHFEYICCFFLVDCVEWYIIHKAYQ